MATLLGGAMVLILCAAVALVMGWIGASTGLVQTSVVASVGAGIVLALAYHRSTEP